MQEVAKLTKRQRYWLDIITKSGGVMKYYTPLGNEAFGFPDSDKKISKYMMGKLLNAGVISPQNDGLFGDSQTFKVA